MVKGYENKYFSVITENPLGTMKQATEGILKSTVMPDEVIVVDRGPNPTLNIVSSNNSYIKILDDDGLGYRHAIDIGLKNSEEKHVTMVDDDVAISSVFLKKATGIIENGSCRAAIAGKPSPETEEMAIVNFHKDDLTSIKGGKTC